MIALDASVIIAALSSWHDRREAAEAAINKALNARAGVVIPAHALFEAYSVLTRIPPPRRLTPGEAFALLRASFSTVRIAVAPARFVWSMFGSLAATGLGGGITHDAVILAAAESAGATSLLTLNARHFQRLNSHIRIEVP